MSRTVIIIIIVAVILIGALFLYLRNRNSSSETVEEELPPAMLTPQERPLLIFKAEYGCNVPSCVKMDVTSILQDLITNDMLIIPHEEDSKQFVRLFGRDPSPNLPKTLDITFQTGLSGQRKTRSIPDTQGVRLNVN